MAEEGEEEGKLRVEPRGQGRLETTHGSDCSSAVDFVIMQDEEITSRVGQK